MKTKHTFIEIVKSFDGWIDLSFQEVESNFAVVPRRHSTEGLRKTLPITVAVFIANVLARKRSVLSANHALPIRTQDQQRRHMP